MRYTASVEWSGQIRGIVFLISLSAGNHISLLGRILRLIISENTKHGNISCSGERLFCMKESTRFAGKNPYPYTFPMFLLVWLCMAPSAAQTVKVTLYNNVNHRMTIFVHGAQCRSMVHIAGRWCTT